MAGRGRVAGFKMSEEHRTKIANSQILKRLIEFAEGKKGVEMSGPQVTAAMGLLKKIMPDLSNIEIETGEGGFVVKVASDTTKL